MMILEETVQRLDRKVYPMFHIIWRENQSILDIFPPSWNKMAGIQLQPCFPNL